VPTPKTHEGYDWIYVPSGRVRLVLGDQDLVLAAGEAAEFDCRVRHWFGSADAAPAEVLGLFGRQANALTFAPDQRPGDRVRAGTPWPARSHAVMVSNQLLTTRKRRSASCPERARSVGCSSIGPPGRLNNRIPLPNSVGAS
jgi:Cupin domain